MKPNLRRLSVISVILAGVALVALLAWTLHRNQGEETLLARAKTQLSKIVLAEERLKSDVIAARFGLEANYDGIVADTAQLEREQRALSGMSLPASTHPIVTAYLAAARNERLHVKEFKSLNSVVRFSLQSFLYQIHHLEPKLPDTGPNRNVQHALANILIGVVRSRVDPNAGPATPGWRQRAREVFQHAKSSLPQHQQVLQRLASQFDVLEQKGPILDAEPPRVPWRPVGLSHAGVAA